MYFKPPQFMVWPGAMRVPSPVSSSLRWRHNDRDSVSNHQPHECLLNRLFRRRSKKTSKLRVTGLCPGNSPGTSEFPAQMASNAENVSIWWRHHDVPTAWLPIGTVSGFYAVWVLVLLWRLGPVSLIRNYYDSHTNTGCNLWTKYKACHYHNSSICRSRW